MVLSNPVADVPFNITRLSHVVLTSRDLDATRYFYESGLGLEVTEHSDEHLCLRAIEEVAHHSLRFDKVDRDGPCLLYTSPSPRDRQKSRMPSSA